MYSTYNITHNQLSKLNLVITPQQSDGDANEAENTMVGLPPDFGVELTHGRVCMNGFHMHQAARGVDT